MKTTKQNIGPASLIALGAILVGLAAAMASSVAGSRAAAGSAVFAPPSAASATTPAPTANPAPSTPPSAATDPSAGAPVPSVSPAAAKSAPAAAPPGVEKHLANIRQLTFGDENAEAYFDATGKRLIFQSTHGGRDCDQVYTMSSKGKNLTLVSTGKGRCTCSYWFPSGKRILYASTHLSSEACPPKPDHSRGYVWALYDDYEIFTADPDGKNIKRLTNHPGYDAEATIAEDGSRILFTSLRDGDVDLYSMAPDGTDVKRITHEPGYDGGGFFSPDGKRIVYRASRPRTPKELEDWNALLTDRLVRPTTLEIQIANADGSNAHAITMLGAASFAPCWFRDGRRLLFASNVGDPKGRNFDLYMINDDGSGLERVTWNDTFDGFPLFSRDGKTLVFASNRNDAKPGDTNIFIADWVP